MRHFAFTAIILVAVLVLSSGLSARDFIVDDFDPADPEQTEMYSLALEDLMDELTIVATEEDGDEIFVIMPFPMELIALETQFAIHEGNIIDPNELADLIAQANMDKPTQNSFAFVLDGEPMWVRREVAMYYTRLSGEPDMVRVPVVPVGDPVVTEDATMVTGWAMMAADADELRDFLASPMVVLVVGDEEESVTLDCGFWRRWVLFDLGEEEDPEALRLGWEAEMDAEEDAERQAVE